MTAESAHRLPAPTPGRAFLSGADRSALLRPGQVAVYLGDRDGTFPDRGRDVFDGAVPYVTDGQHSRQTRLQRHRRTVERPAGTGVVEIRAGEDETLWITTNTFWPRIAGASLTPAP